MFKLIRSKCFSVFLKNQIPVGNFKKIRLNSEKQFLAIVNNSLENLSSQFEEIE